MKAALFLGVGQSCIFLSCESVTPLSVLEALEGALRSTSQKTVRNRSRASQEPVGNQSGTSVESVRNQSVTSVEPVGKQTGTSQ